MERSPDLPVRCVTGISVPWSFPVQAACSYSENGPCKPDVVDCRVQKLRNVSQHEAGACTNRAQDMVMFVTVVTWPAGGGGAVSNGPGGSHPHRQT